MTSTTNFPSIRHSPEIASEALRTIIDAAPAASWVEANGELGRDAFALFAADGSLIRVASVEEVQAAQREIVAAKSPLFAALFGRKAG